MTMSLTTGTPTGFRSAESLEEALGTLEELGDEATILAGGTDVIIQYMRGELKTGCLVHIERIPELRSSSVGTERVGLAALLTHRALATNADLASALPALAEACSTVGGWQTQEIGTIAGNVCNASPAADTLPPLLVANAVIHLESAVGRRDLDLDRFVVGRRAIASNPDEMVTSISVESCADSTGEAYLKIAPRSAMEVAVAGLAVRLRFDEEVVSEARVAAGAVAPTPFRCQGAERALVGSRLESAAVAEAAKALAEQAEPIDDARATANYRRKVIARALHRVVETARRRATKR
jgi:carbon-monoxide dehydrogenase medium subunit